MGVWRLLLEDGASLVQRDYWQVLLTVENVVRPGLTVIAELGVLLEMRDWGIPIAGGILGSLMQQERVHTAAGRLWTSLLLGVGNLNAARRLGPSLLLGVRGPHYC